jgi:site-specific recombinase XerD
MFNKMKLLFYHSKKRSNLKGEAPVYCRITTNGEVTEISTGISLKGEFFRDGYVLSSHSQYQVYNAKIDYFKTRLHSIHLDLCFKEIYASASEIKTRFLIKPVKQKKFVELLSERLCKIRETANSKDTVRGYETRERNILKFLASKNLTHASCSGITEALLMSFKEEFLRGKKHSYINKHLFLISDILKQAVKEKFIEKNPVYSVKKEKDDPNAIIALTKDELTSLERYRFASKRIQQIADLYIFQCYTGFAYADLLNFDPTKNIHLLNGKLWIIDNRQKTNREALLPLFKKASDILKKYNNVLPVISLQKYNSYLKEVADIIGIEKQLTTHTARKTFAMVKLNEGFSIESVSRMLGHKTISITQNVYAKVTHVRIESEQKRLGIK